MCLEVSCGTSSAGPHPSLPVACVTSGILVRTMSGNGPAWCGRVSYRLLMCFVIGLEQRCEACGGCSPRTRGDTGPDAITCSRRPTCIVMAPSFWSGAAAPQGIVFGEEHAFGVTPERFCRGERYKAGTTSANSLLRVSGSGHHAKTNSTL